MFCCKKMGVVQPVATDGAIVMLKRPVLLPTHPIGRLSCPISPNSGFGDELLDGNLWVMAV